MKWCYLFVNGVFAILAAVMLVSALVEPSLGSIWVRLGVGFCGDLVLGFIWCFTVGITMLDD